MASLNPSANEWTPTLHPAQPPPPPCAAVAVAFFPVPWSPYHKYHSFYFQDFVPFPQLLPPPPEINTTPPPTCGAGEGKNMGFPAAAKKPRFLPNRRRPNTGSTFGTTKASPRLRQEWRPKNTDYGGSSSLPPPDPASEPLSVTRSSSQTTIMIRNIPNQLRRDGMLEFLDKCCRSFSLEYDFLYLPTDFGSEDNLGYAFVNFTSGKAAITFKNSLQKYRWGIIETAKGVYATKKICAISWAAIQGKEGQMKKFQNYIFACDNVDFLPVELDPPRNGSNAHLSPPKVVGKLLQRN